MKLGEPSWGPVRAHVFPELQRVVAIVNGAWYWAPASVLLGAISSLAEAAGVSVVIAFVYTLAGRSSEIATSGLFTGIERLIGTPSAGWFGVAVGFLIAVRIAASVSYAILNATIAESLSERVRDRLHADVLTRPYEEIRGYEQSTLLELVATMSGSIAAAFAALSRIFINACSIVVFAVFVALISWKVFAVACIGWVLTSVAVGLFSGPVQRIGQQTIVSYKVMAEHILVTLQGLRTIRIYGQEPAHDARFRKASSQARLTAVNFSRLAAFVSPISEFGYLAVAAIVIFGADGLGITFAQCLGGVALLYRMQPHVAELKGNWMSLAQLRPQVRTVLEFIDRQPLPPAPDRAFPGLRSAVKFDNVSFSYASGIFALHAVSFTIPAGSTTALIGPSGSGKSTIVNLILRLYDPTSGTISVDEEPLAGFARASWLSHVAVAGQDIELTEGDVIDNIRMSDANASEAEVLAAARIADVSSFIDPLPDGYRTWVGQEGVRFSGGQRQRIGLARAILRNPDLLILDEAMNALDNALEENLRHSLEQLRSGLTTLVITHKLDSIRSADHCIWIEDGRVRASGPTETVLALVPGGEQ